jgi:1-acyl-sn-glycerol-3-phosphate acyltransferase
MFLDPSDRILRAAHAVAGLAARYHQADLEGVERLPDGPALLVGNHGLFGLETLAFFWLLHDRTGRQPRGLADRLLFGNRIARPIMERVGGHVGTRETAVRLLGQGHLVVCYPGGAREVFKAPRERYTLRWDRALGFARVAIEARVPVVPFAGLGVDESFVNLGHLERARELLGRYAPPIAVGPFPTRFRFVLGRPILPPEAPAHAPLLKAAAERAVLQLLASKGAHAISSEPARVVS